MSLAFSHCVCVCVCEDSAFERKGRGGVGVAIAQVTDVAENPCLFFLSLSIVQCVGVCVCVRVRERVCTECSQFWSADARMTMGYISMEDDLPPAVTRHTAHRVCVWGGELVSLPLHCTAHTELHQSKQRCGEDRESTGVFTLLPPNCVCSHLEGNAIRPVLCH